MEGGEPGASPKPGDQIHVEGPQTFHDANRVAGAQTGHIGGNANTIVGQIHNTITLTAEVVKQLTEQAKSLDTRRSAIRTCRQKINEVKASIDRTSGIFSSTSMFLSNVITNKENLTKGVQKIQIQIMDHEQMLSSYTQKLAQFDPETDNPEEFGKDLDIMKTEVAFRREQLQVDLICFQMSINFEKIESAPKDVSDNILNLLLSIHRNKMAFQAMRYHSSSKPAGSESGYRPEHGVPPRVPAGATRDVSPDVRVYAPPYPNLSGRPKIVEDHDHHNSKEATKTTLPKKGTEFTEDTQHLIHWEDHIQDASSTFQKFPFEPAYVCWYLSTANSPRSKSKEPWKYYKRELLHIGSDELSYDIRSRANSREKEVLRQYSRIKSRRQRRAIDKLLVEQDTSLQMQEPRVRWVMVSLEFETEDYGLLCWGKRNTVGMMMILRTELIPPHGSHCTCNLCLPATQEAFFQSQIRRHPTFHSYTGSAPSGTATLSTPSQAQKLDAHAPGRSQASNHHRTGPQQQTFISPESTTIPPLTPTTGPIPHLNGPLDGGFLDMGPSGKELPAQSLRPEPSIQHSSQNKHSLSMTAKKPGLSAKKKRGTSSEKSSASQPGQAKRFEKQNYIHIHAHARDKAKPIPHSSSILQTSALVSGNDSTRARRQHRPDRMRDTSPRIHLAAKIDNIDAMDHNSHNRNGKDSSFLPGSYPEDSSMLNQFTETPSRLVAVPSDQQSGYQSRDPNQTQSWQVPGLPMTPRPGWISPRLASLDVQIPPDMAVERLNRQHRLQPPDAFLPQRRVQPSHDQDHFPTSNPNGWDLYLGRRPTPRKRSRERGRYISHAVPSAPSYPPPPPPPPPHPPPSSINPTTDYSLRRPRPAQHSTTAIPLPPMPSNSRTNQFNTDPSGPSDRPQKRVNIHSPPIFYEYPADDYPHSEDRARNPIPPRDPSIMTDEEKKEAMSSLIAAFRPVQSEAREE